MMLEKGFKSGECDKCMYPMQCQFIICLVAWLFCRKVKFARTRKGSNLILLEVKKMVARYFLCESKPAARL